MMKSVSRFSSRYLLSMKRSRHLGFVVFQAEIERAGGVGKAKEKSEREKAARQWVGMLLGLPDELFCRQSG